MFSLIDHDVVDLELRCLFVCVCLCFAIYFWCIQLGTAVSPERNKHNSHIQRSKTYSGTDPIWKKPTHTHISKQTPKLIAPDLCFISTQMEKQTKKFQNKTKVSSSRPVLLVQQNSKHTHTFQNKGQNQLQQTCVIFSTQMENKHTHFKKQPKLILAGLCFEFSKIKKHIHFRTNTKVNCSRPVFYFNTSGKTNTNTFQNKSQINCSRLVSLVQHNWEDKHTHTLQNKSQINCRRLVSLVQRNWENKHTHIA